MYKRQWIDCPCFTNGTRISLSLAISPSVARIPLRDSDISVSYTHLDVYKRQLRHLATGFYRIIHKISIQYTYIPMIKLHPVSYTHLDVYKRQVIYYHYKDLLLVFYARVSYNDMVRVCTILYVYDRICLLYTSRCV